MKIMILGAGLSGITTAYFLQQYKQVDEIHIIEKEYEVGGLCRSLRKDGYVYDSLGITAKQGLARLLEEFHLNEMTSERFKEYFRKEIEKEG